MSLIENRRLECGKILQNHNGQYFFVCSTCDLEFVTLSSFLEHHTNGHDDEDFQKQSDDLTMPFTKKLNFDRKIKVSKKGSNDLTVALSEQKDVVQESKVDKDTSDSMDDSSEPAHKIKAVLRTVSRYEPPRRTILVSPKANKPARNVTFARTFGNKANSSCVDRNPSFTSSSNRMQATTKESSEKYKCKNCSAVFTTMVNLDSHEIVCMMLPMKFYCDRCSRSYDDKSRLQIHKRVCHRS